MFGTVLRCNLPLNDSASEVQGLQISAVVFHLSVVWTINGRLASQYVRWKISTIARRLVACYSAIK